MKPHRVKLSPGVVRRIRLRKAARVRLVERSREFSTWTVGKPGREKAGALLWSAIRRVRDLFGRRAHRLEREITRRAFSQ